MESAYPYFSTAVDISLGDIYSNVDIDYQAIVQRMREEGLSEEQIDNTRLILSADAPLKAHHKNKDIIKITQGKYLAKTDEIILYEGTQAQMHQTTSLGSAFAYWLQAFKNGDDHENSDQKAKEVEQNHLQLLATERSKEMSGTLLHEIRHRKHTLLHEPAPGTRGFRLKLGARLFGVYALSYCGIQGTLDLVESLQGQETSSLLTTIATFASAAYVATKFGIYTPEQIYDMDPEEKSARQAETDLVANIVNIQYRTYKESLRRERERAKIANVKTIRFPVALMPDII